MADVHRATRGFLYQVSEYPSVKLSLTISIATEPKLKPSTTPEVIVVQGFPAFHKSFRGSEGNIPVRYLLLWGCGEATMQNMT